MLPRTETLDIRNKFSLTELCDLPVMMIKYTDSVSPDID